MSKFLFEKFQSVLEFNSHKWKNSFFVFDNSHKLVIEFMLLKQ